MSASPEIQKETQKILYVLAQLEEQLRNLENRALGWAVTMSTVSGTPAPGDSVRLSPFLGQGRGLLAPKCDTTTVQ